MTEENKEIKELWEAIAEAAGPLKFAIDEYSQALSNCSSRNHPEIQDVRNALNEFLPSFDLKYCVLEVKMAQMGILPD